MSLRRFLECNLNNGLLLDDGSSLLTLPVGGGCCTGSVGEKKKDLKSVSHCDCCSGGAGVPVWRGKEESRVRGDT